MEYTRTMLSSYSHEQYWNYWIQKVNFTQADHYYYPGIVVLNYVAADATTTNGPHPEHELCWSDDLPPLFLKHEQIFYYCFVILSCTGILYVSGVKLWEKY